MNDGYDDGFKGEVKPLNIRKIPKNKTAVALKNSAGGKKVPTIAASGRGEMADKILAMAYAHGINVREDRDLAELLARIDIDSPIPSEAFMAVGEILSYIYRANNADDPFNSVLEEEE